MIRIRRFLMVCLVLAATIPAVFAGKQNVPTGPHIAAMNAVTNAPAVLAPKGCLNLALFLTVNSGPSAPSYNGALNRITDGNKESDDTSVVLLRSNTHWIQIDLGQPCELYAIAVWHKFHNQMEMDVARGVVVQVADNPEFSGNVRTLFNNDYDNLNGLGAGSDQEYYETRFGKVIHGLGVQGRYVRLYCRGFHQSKQSAYLEVEVWGVPSLPKSGASYQPVGSKKKPAGPAMEPLKIRLPNPAFL